MKNQITARVLVMALAVFGALGAWAQDQDTQPSYDQQQPPSYDQQQPPYDDQQQAPENSPGVARLSMMQGDVSTQRGDSGDWTAGALNAPLMAGDKISTGDDARAEIQLGPANILRMGERSLADIGTLSRSQSQVQIAQGLVNYSVFRSSEAEPEIDTPNVAIHPARMDGSYRIEVNPDGSETRIVVHRGEAEISTPEGSTRVSQGQEAIIRGSGNDVQYKIAEAPDRDDWDRWNNDRDHTIQNAQAWRRTNPNYVGSEDLDAYGSWSNVPDYGPVWVPSAAPGWAPYADGRWVWQPYYGWTWVSNEPWGWAPYHYGRWMYYGNSWAWWPGPVNASYYPVWAPAYVSFFGFGGGVGFSFGFGFGSIGWYPVGPCDFYRPWWGGYGRSYNVVNVTNIYNVNNFNHYRTGVANGFLGPLHGGNQYSNFQMMQTHPQMRLAMSTLPAEHFGKGIGRISPATPQQLGGAHLFTGAVPVVPSKESLSASGRSASPSTLHGAQPAHFFGRTAPMAREPFTQQQAKLQQVLSSGSSHVASQVRNNNGGSFLPNTVQHGAPQPVGRGNEPGTVARNNGWSGFGENSGKPSPSTPYKPPVSTAPEPGRPTATPQPRPLTQTAPSNPQNGWHRFNEPAPAHNNPSPAPGKYGSSPAPSSPAPYRPPVTTHPGNSYHPAEPPARNNNGWSGFGQQPRTSTGSSYHQQWTRPASPQPVPRVESGSGGWNQAPRPQSRSHGWGQPSPAPAPKVDSGSRGGSQPPRAESGPRGYSEPARSQSFGGSSARPPLQIHQPIVVPRSAPSAPHSAPSAPSNHGSSGGGHSAPSSSGGSPHHR
jgi:hypothetical protein